MRRDFGFGDAEPVHALADDVDGLLELGIRDGARHCLRGQGDLGTASKIEAESGCMIGTRKPGPDGERCEQDHEDPEHATVLRAW